MIIAYKFAKAPAMLALAVWLSVARVAPFTSVSGWCWSSRRAAVTLGAAGALDEPIPHAALAIDAAVLAWIDGLSTALEAALLWRGSAWGEWFVVLAIAVLLPSRVWASFTTRA